MVSKHRGETLPDNVIMIYNTSGLPLPILLTLDQDIEIILLSSRQTSNAWSIP